MSDLKKTFSKLGNLNEAQVNKAAELGAKLIYKGKLSPKVRQRLQAVLRWLQRILTIAGGLWILLPDPVIGSVDDGGVAAGLITWLLINASRLEKAKKLVTMLADAAEGAPETSIQQQPAKLAGPARAASFTVADHSVPPQSQTIRVSIPRD